jgi:ribosomal protein S18 acetylase RimI-like enzyme
MSIENKEQPPEVKVSTAQPEDARGFVEVIHETWLATYPNEALGITKDDIEERFKDSFTKEGLELRTKALANPSEGAAFFVAKDGDKIIGICSIRKDAESNQLQSIYVLPEYQGQGAGQLLWEEAEKHFNASNDTIVHSATYNTNAINFYKKLGFVETGKEFFDERFRMKSGVIIPETELVKKAEQLNEDPE